MTTLIALTIACSQPMSPDMKAAHVSLHASQDLSESLTASLWDSSSSNGQFAGMQTSSRGELTQYEYEGDVELQSPWSGTAQVRGLGAQGHGQLGFHSVATLDGATYDPADGPKVELSGVLDLMVQVEGDDLSAPNEGATLMGVVSGELTTSDGHVVEIDYRWTRPLSAEAPELEGTAGLYMADRLWDPTL